MLAADENDTFAYAITIGDRAVGSIGAFRQGNIHRRTAELGYYLAEAYWGRGIMTEAIRQLCGIVFETTDILRIYAEPFAYNTGSRRALEQAGFTFEGTLKNNAVKNGKVLDMTMYSLTKEPYTRRRLTEAEVPAALSLAWEVFSQYESPAYSPEGTEEFRKCLQDEGYLEGIAYYGAFDGQTLIGQIGIRPGKRHICFFFVKGSYHRKGVGTRLFRQLLRDLPDGTITLNSSPYGLPFYPGAGLPAYGSGADRQRHPFYAHGIPPGTPGLVPTGRTLTISGAGPACGCPWTKDAGSFSGLIRREILSVTSSPV